MHHDTAPLPFTYAPPPNTGLHVLHLDKYLVVVNKPYGLLSVPGRGGDKQDSLASRVQAEFADALTVHRLDLETSGVIVMARGAEMHRRLSALFREREVDKRYIAVIAGQLAQPAGEVNLPLLVDWPNRPKQAVNFTDGKPSLTRYQQIAYDAASDTTRVALEPVTGRTHQLRVHMASLGHPILGDQLYAGEFRDAAPRLLLHAEYLAFPHPLTGVPVVCESPAPF